MEKQNLFTKPAKMDTTDKNFWIYVKTTKRQLL